LLYGRDIDANLTLFRDVLGFNLTEQVVGPDRKFLIGVFLTCSNKARTSPSFVRTRTIACTMPRSFWAAGTKSFTRPTSFPSATSRSTSGRRGTVSPGARRSISRPLGQPQRSLFGGYIWYPDRPVITWHDTEIGRAIFYHDRKLNEAFLNVTT
jgi:catechol 2,3-dioxygenase